MRAFVLACAALLACGIVSLAYFPMQCSVNHAASDFADADAIVIARCIKVERRVEQLPNDKFKSYYYIATLKVGRTIKGTLKVDEEIEMLEGAYLARQEDNAQPTYLAQCNTHPRAGLDPDGVFLLYIKQHNDKTWSPVSCHYSIHEVVALVNEKTKARSLGVNESLGMRSREEQKKTVPLEEFLKRKETAAAEAAKKRAAEKSSSTK